MSDYRMPDDWSISYSSSCRLSHFHSCSVLSLKSWVLSLKRLRIVLTLDATLTETVGFCFQCKVTMDSDGKHLILIKKWFFPNFVENIGGSTCVYHAKGAEGLGA